MVPSEKDGCFVLLCKRTLLNCKSELFNSNVYKVMPRNSDRSMESAHAYYEAAMEVVSALDNPQGLKQALLSLVRKSGVHSLVVARTCYVQVA